MIGGLAVALFACHALASAAAPDINFDQGVGVKAVVDSLQARFSPKAPPAKDGVAEWTVMVYMNAKNDLDRYALSNINLMEQVGSTDRVKIAVALGRLAIHDLSEGGWTGQRRYIIQKDSDPGHVTSPVL